MAKLIWALAYIAVLTGAHCKSGYLLTAPKVLDAGSSDRICLTLTEVNGPGTVQVQLLKERVNVTIAETSVNFPRDDPCFYLEIPNVSYTYGRLKVTGNFQTKNSDGGTEDYSFSSESPVSIASRSSITFIQTDKAIYKPGQKVQFRILTVNQFLEPLYVPVSKVYIQNPNGVRVAQWTDLTNENGLFQLDMQLSEEPKLGFWNIYAQVAGTVHTKSFEVNEYVLPKFQVTITPPTYLLSTDETAKWKVCAKYTYGKDVVGTLKLKMKYNVYRWEQDQDYPENNLDTKINGCHDLIVDVNVMEWNTSRIHYKSIKVEATVKEDGTDIEFGASSSTDISHEPLKFEDLSQFRHNSFFNPGLPTMSKYLIKRPDNSPAPNEAIKVCYNSAGLAGRCSEFTSDENGIVKFTVPPLDIKSSSMSAQLSAVNYKDQSYNESGRYAHRLKIRQPHTSKYHAAWYSPSGSFIQVTPIYEDLSCNDDVNLEVLYTTDDQDIQLYYQVMSRGRIVENGIHSYKFNESDYSEDDSYIKGSLQSEKVKRRAYEETANYTLPENIGKFNVPIKISAKMSPVARVLVYYIRPDGEVVASYVVLHVKPCFNNDVSLKFEQASVKPGTPAIYKIAASPKSLCAIGAVDKSVHLLRSDNQITPDKVFSILKSFDASGSTTPRLVDNHKYCENKLKDVLTEEELSTVAPPEIPDIPVIDGPISGTFGGDEKTGIEDIDGNDDAAEDGEKIVIDAVPMEGRFKRSSPPWFNNRYFSNYLDSLQAFDESGSIIMSDFEVETRLCSKRRYTPVDAFSGFDRGPQPQFQAGVVAPAPAPAAAGPIQNSVIKAEVGAGGVNEAVEVRNYFPETWLWDLEVVGDSGQIVKEADIPHTITEWVGSMFCTSKTAGLGVSPSASIKAFQPFFVSYALPYSVVRKEKVPVVVSVFNYLSGCIPIKVTLSESDDFTLLSNSNSHKMCVCGGKPVTHRFRILPTSLGQINLTVHGYSLKDEQHEVCSSDKHASNIEARDAITKPLLVEPEGFPQESTESVLFCPSESNKPFKKIFELSPPDDMVEDSARAYFSVSGDIMGPSLNGIEKLVAQPTGCGEQNMVIFSPNIYVLQYLNGTGRITGELEEKSLKFMKIGYQRELNYRHSDGSYSAFGESDPEGSSWLTAFVVKSFAEAQQFIDIDPVDLKKSTDWLLTKQQEDGCFPFTGMVHHQDMKGGVGKGVPTGLTAYTLITLLESKTPVSQEVVDKAFACINNDTNPNNYILALTAYAHVLNNDEEKAKSVLDTLYVAAQTDGADTYWSANSKSVQVELGAYVILSLVEIGGPESINKALGIVSWIARQRNANGGFVSTQDTVVALQAFAKFAVLQAQNKQDLSIFAEANGFEELYGVNSTNSLLMQTDKIAELPNIVDISAAGDGCGLAMATLKYNRKNVKPSEAFELSVIGKDWNWNCKSQKIDICTKYKIPNEKSNMAVLTVKMVSGFIPDKSTLRYLKDKKNLNLKRYELDANFINFYFDYLSNNHTCFSIDVIQEVEVEDAKPATVFVYDYYRTELRLETSYEFPPAECQRPQPIIFRGEAVELVNDTTVAEDSNSTTTTEFSDSTTTTETSSTTTTETYASTTTTEDETTVELTTTESRV